jgi:hypothetical protein
MAARRILVFGASYGGLLGAKLALAGHAVTLVCRERNAALINEKGIVIRMPIKGRDGLVELRSRELRGSVRAITTAEADPSASDLVVLGMQEPQYGLPGVRELLEATARARVPCMSIMNMPPPPFLARIPGLDVRACVDSFTDASVWDAFDPRLLTLCSPDPQAFRPPEEEGNVLQVRLATNFKAARFDDDAATALLRELGESVDNARFEVDGESLDIPVKLKVHESIFVPLAKWPMLLTGNYRCILDEGIRPIQVAVNDDLEASRVIYEWVASLCRTLGAADEDLVAFDKYAAAASALKTPSSAARALLSGAPNIERIDRLVRSVAAQKGLAHPEIDAIVARVDGWIVRNRLKG